MRIDAGPRPNVLLVRLKSLGDVLFTLPAVHAVRTALPSARLCFLVSKEYAPLLSGFREIDTVLALDRARYRGGNPGGMMGETFSLLRNLRRHRFELAVDFQGYGETALLTWWSGAGRRWGCRHRFGQQWTYTHGMGRNAALHPADYNLELLRQCGLPPGPVRNQFVLPPDALDQARRFFQENGLRLDRPTLFIQPFTSSPQKNWPLERFLAVARHWRERHWQVLFGGGPSEQSALEPIRGAGFAVAAGVPLLVSGGLANLSTLVLGGDTGLLHLAVAMDKRVLMLMQSVAPGMCHPFQHPDWTVLPPAGQPLEAITVQAVDEAIAKAQVR